MSFLDSTSKKAIDGLLGSLYTLVHDKVKGTLAKGAITKSTAAAHKHVLKLRFVKTLWHSDTPVDIFSFYHPSRLSLAFENTHRTITADSLSELPEAVNLLIEGTIGQGKSIFLRYLACRELALGKTIPLLVELRRLDDTTTLSDLILTELKAYGFAGTNLERDVLTTAGKLHLLLDGFDEVPDRLRASLVTELETLTRLHPRVRLIVSSRPNSGLNASPHFSVASLSPLRNDEYIEVIGRLEKNALISTKIIGALSDLPDVQSLLTTPLMVSLLLLRYRIDNSLPENLIAFYDQIFDLLIRRHDRTKAGYERERRSPLSKSELEAVFNAISFITARDNITNPSVNILTVAIVKALPMISRPASPPDDILADIIDITCLILREGTEARFIHKSIQEYHAAEFVRLQPDKWAVGFYDGVTREIRIWREELSFLRQIDSYRYYSMFVISGLGRELKAPDIYHDLASCFAINMPSHMFDQPRPHSNAMNVSFTFTISGDSCLRDLASDAGNMILHDIFSIVPTALSNSPRAMEMLARLCPIVQPDRPGEFAFPFAEISDLSEIREFFEPWAETVVAQAQAQLTEAKDYVERRDRALSGIELPGMRP